MTRIAPCPSKCARSARTFFGSDRHTKKRGRQLAPTAIYVAAGTIQRSSESGCHTFKFLEYEQQLANDVANLGKKQQAMVFTIIKHIVQAGGNLSCHLDWAAVKDQTLTLQYKRSLVKKRPGWKHYAMSHYVDTFGSLETNGKLLCGHRRWELDGVDGVLVPDDAVTKIRYTEEIAAQLDMQARS